MLVTQIAFLKSMLTRSCNLELVVKRCLFSYGYYEQEGLIYVVGAAHRDREMKLEYMLM